MNLVFLFILTQKIKKRKRRDIFRDIFRLFLHECLGVYKLLVEFFFEIICKNDIFYNNTL